MQDDRVERLERRVAVLERSRRRWTAAALAVGVVAAIGLMSLGASASSHYEEPLSLERIKARSLDIVNADGEAVLHLGVRDDGAGGLWIANAAGDPVVKLNQTANGGGRIAVLAGGGRETVVISSKGEEVGDVWTSSSRSADEPGRE